MLREELILVEEVPLKLFLKYAQDPEAFEYPHNSIPK